MYNLKCQKSCDKYRKGLSAKDKKQVNDAIDGILNKIMFFEAVKENNIDKIKDLLDKGADANVANQDGKTALHYAAKKVMKR